MVDDYDKFSLSDGLSLEDEFGADKGTVDTLNEYARQLGIAEAEKQEQDLLADFGRFISDMVVVGGEMVLGADIIVAVEREVATASILFAAKATVSFPDPYVGTDSLIAHFSLDEATVADMPESDKPAVIRDIAESLYVSLRLQYDLFHNGEPE